MTYEHIKPDAGCLTGTRGTTTRGCGATSTSRPSQPHVWNRGSFEWALTINWEFVNTLVREHRDELAPTLGGARLVATTHWAALSAADQQGLASLYREPPYATTLQISGGGHRFAAMRQQGVRWALGQCYISDVGAGVPELHAYLPLDG